MIKILMILALTIFWASCTSTLRPQVSADVSFKFDRCRVRCYDMETAKKTSDNKCNRFYKKDRYPTNWYEFYTLDRREKQDVLVFKSGNYHINTCDELIGFYAEPVAKEIMPWVRSNIRRSRNR